MLKFTGLIADPKEEKDNNIISIESYQNNLTFPKTGINVLYGKTTLQEFQDITQCEIQTAIKEGRHPINYDMVEISCLGLRNNSDLHWFDHYKDKSIFDIRRLSASERVERSDNKSVKEEILDIFYESALKDYGFSLLKENGCIHSKTGKPTAVILEKMPQYIDILKEQAEWMENIDAIIWGAKTSGSFDQSRQIWSTQSKSIVRATIFNAKCIVMTLAHDQKYRISPLSIPSIITPLSMRRMRKQLGT